MIDIPVITLDELAFGTTKALPPYDRGRDNHRFTRLASSLFFKGGNLEAHGLRIKDGLDRDAVYRAISAHLRSWEPKHEHKEVGVGLMIEAWFEDAA